MNFGRLVPTLAGPDRMLRLRTATATAVAVALGSFGVAPAAHALPGPTTLTTGFVDEAAADIGRDWPLTAERLGSSLTRVTVLWADVAPTQPSRSFHPTDPADPAYSFGVLDAYVKVLAAHRQQVVLMAIDAPAWAENNPPAKAVPGTWRPSAAAFGAFARALATRYSGHFPDPRNPSQDLPRVTYFQAWNEPNLFYSLSPQWTRTRGQWVPNSPLLYRGLLNSFYANIKAVRPDDHVLAAGTAPYGDPPGGPRMPPVVFLRELLCLHGEALHPGRCPHPAHLDIYDHHPYALTPTIHARSADDVSVPDLGRLERVMRRAVQTRRVLPAGPKPLWVTEIGWDTHPPDATPVSLGLQARYLPLAFYTLWRQGVGRVLWVLLRDPDVPNGHIPAMGVYFARGRPKPSAAAFRFPFVALPGAIRLGTIWGVAPRSGPVRIQERVKHHWRVIATLPGTRGRVFYARRSVARHALLRAVSGTSTSPAWSTS